LIFHAYVSLLYKEAKLVLPNGAFAMDLDLEDTLHRCIEVSLPSKMNHQPPASSWR
jgi:hypothetical protein